MKRTNIDFQPNYLASQVLFALALMAGSSMVYAQNMSVDGVVPSAQPSNAKDTNADGAKADADQALDAKAITTKVVITGNTVANRAPVQASLKATQPQSIITATFIEQAVTPLADFNAVARIAPSVGSGVSANGAGLAETKVTLRGFQDGEYNMTYDGIPFGDTNNPTHHSTSYFPARIIGGMVVERGPGNASNLGQATFGGSINLFSKELSADANFSPYFTVASWNTKMYGVQIDSGILDKYDGLNWMFNGSRLSTDGYLSQSAVREDNYQIKVQKNIGTDTTITFFSTYNKIFSNVADKGGVTLAQVALYGKNYALNPDPNSQNYSGYNFNNKKTDFEYLSVQTKLGSWSVDNTLYTYAYNNDTYSGQDASGATANGTKAAPAGNKNVPGYNKLNSYRVKGDILKLSDKTDAGLLRVGVWLETSDTDRHTYDLDWTLGVRNPKEATAPKDVAYEQKSSWKQYQPFVEFEWAATSELTITPGVKYMHFERSLDAEVNQGTRIPTKADQTYQATLPFLTANYSINKETSTYAQVAKGFLVPDLSMFYVNNPNLSKPEPQTSTNYQVGVVHQASNLVFDADIYYIDFNNKIASTGTGNDLIYYNQGGVVYKGVEASVTYYLGAGFSAHVNGSINQARTKGTNLQVAKAPKSTDAFGFLYKDGAWYGSIIAKTVGDQFAKDGEPAAYKIAAYTSTDLTMGYRWKNPGRFVKNLKVQLGIDNLFNKESATSISASSKGVQFDQYTFMPKRGWSLSTSIDF
ncbi:TonB-dependent receptor [Undibacterium sp. LX40W]|uniref:TonB-dependent receptor n=1 Tax=Undibacterium nitidum TaxID=2762298 RepID=A0A923HQL6_9BURK|nr:MULTISPECIES: TonB-dependent receptor [Undibacterium]MBC3881480.1 TonB-dependent receptor [Undibacterium nitidum]MBC3891738.1 TonB-dependent receptor [Undibacterium sp. LX40W]